jgi:tRNA-dihydrouridine synthase
MGNFSTFNKFKPIIEPGSVPGVLGTRDAYANPEAATALGLHGAKAFFPQATAIERMYHAITDTSRYPGMFAPKQSFGEALLQTLTGAAIQEGSTDRGKEGLDRAGARAKDEKHAPFHKFSSDYIADIEAGKVPRNPSYVAKARDIRTFANGKKHMDAATRKTQDILASDYFTGDDRYKQIRMHLDWVYALADRLKELAVEEGMMGAEAP